VLSYSYDSSGRLTGATDKAAGSFGILGYSYDPNGNRQSETRNASTLPYVYSPPNWLYQKGSDTRSKTPSGNTASSTVLAPSPRRLQPPRQPDRNDHTHHSPRRALKSAERCCVFHYGPSGELLYERDANGPPGATSGWTEDRSQDRQRRADLLLPRRPSGTPQA
jgi:hypothetical protein